MRKFPRRRRRMQLAVVGAASFSLALTPSALARNPKRCGRQNGQPVLAYNLGCAKAHRVMRKLPRGWGGANADVELGGGLPPGVALLFRTRDMDTVLRACEGRKKRRPSRKRLAGAPVVWMAVPYGE